MKVAHYHLGESDTKLAFKYSEFICEEHNAQNDYYDS
jgi:hypothetical protein